MEMMPSLPLPPLSGADAVLDAALQALESGRWDDAWLQVQAGLAHHGTHPQLWELAGVCARWRGDAAAAEQCWRRAFALSPTTALAQRLAELLQSQGRPAEALVVLQARVARGQPGALDWMNLGVLYQALSQWVEAEQAYVHALALDPQEPRILVNQGALLAQTQRPLQAEQAYRAALALLPDDAAAHSNLGLLLESLQRWDEAWLHQGRAAALAPEDPSILGHLAGLLARLGQEEQAHALYRQALRLDPAHAASWLNLGVLCFDTQRWAEAEQAFRTALRLRPEWPAARLNLGQLLLARGQLQAGWALCEGDYPRRAAGALPCFPADTGACRRWRGQPLAGRRLLVWAEQGLGDQIQFSRYLAWVRAQQPLQLSFVCSAALLPLMRSLAGPDQVLPLAAGAQALAQHDDWVALQSLPLLAGTELHRIPGDTPYLQAEPARLTSWAARLPSGGGLRVGLVWRGHVHHDNDADRSLPSLRTLAPLWAVPGVRFISLQKGAGVEEAQAPPPDQPLLNLGPQLQDFADTAAVLAQLDLLISVDTSVAHLAGALRRPCWVLLPARRCDWRWLQGRDDTPWYPGMRLFRQARRGDWQAPVAALAHALAGLRSA